MSEEPSLRQALEVTQHELQLARAELERRRALETPRSLASSGAPVVKLTLLVLIVSGILGVGLGVFAVLRPDLAAELLAWVLQKLCDLLLGRRC